MVERSPDLFDILSQWLTDNYQTRWIPNRAHGCIDHKDVTIWVGSLLDNTLRSFDKSGPDLVCVEYWESKPDIVNLTATDPEFFGKLKAVLDQHILNTI